MKRKKFAILMLLFLAVFAANAQTTTTGGSFDVRAAWTIGGNAVSNNTSSLGTTTASPLNIKTNDTLRMFVAANGNVGIGTNLPQQMLHVVGGNILISNTSSNTKAPGSPNGSILFGGDVTTTDPYGSWGIEYLNNANDGYGLNFWKAWNSNSSVYGKYFLFLGDNGNVGIGTKNPQAKLAVNGGIIAKSVRVNTDAAYWPDYVFASDYKLMSLKELDAFINQYKHLPNIPSASEIEAQGDIDLGEMNAKLLEKIEELTKYVIDLQKQIDELRQNNSPALEESISE